MATGSERIECTPSVPWIASKAPAHGLWCWRACSGARRVFVSSLQLDARHKHNGGPHRQRRRVRTLAHLRVFIACGNAVLACLLYAVRGWALDATASCKGAPDLAASGAAALCVLAAARAALRACLGWLVVGCVICTSPRQGAEADWAVQHFFYPIVGRSMQRMDELSFQAASALLWTGRRAAGSGLHCTGRLAARLAP